MHYKSINISIEDVLFKIHISHSHWNTFYFLTIFILPVPFITRLLGLSFHKTIFGEETNRLYYQCTIEISDIVCLDNIFLSVIFYCKIFLKHDLRFLVSWKLLSTVLIFFSITTENVFIKFLINAPDFTWDGVGTLHFVLVRVNLYEQDIPSGFGKINKLEIGSRR